MIKSLVFIGGYLILVRFVFKYLLPDQEEMQKQQNEICKYLQLSPRKFSMDWQEQAFSKTNKEENI
jgi:hypothetical protein